MSAQVSENGDGIPAEAFGPYSAAIDQMMSLTPTMYRQWLIISFSLESRCIPRLWGNPKKPLANQFLRDSSPCMIRAGFLDPESRSDLIDLARDGLAANRLARRANALLLLDDGMSCEAIAKVLFLDDDTIRTWYRLYEDEGIEGLASFGYDSLPRRRPGAARAA
jgi:hypothetical protein